MTEEEYLKEIRKLNDEIENSTGEKRIALEKDAAYLIRDYTNAYLGPIKKQVIDVNKMVDKLLNDQSVKWPQRKQ